MKLFRRTDASATHHDTSGQSARDVLIQAVFLATVVALVVYLVVTAQSSLEAQGMTSGFGFLFRTTGWPINFSLIPYGFGDPYWKALLIGVLNTLFLAAISLPLASVVGLVVAVLRISGNGVMNFIGTAYVDIFRNIPIILQLFFWYAVYTHLPHPRHALTVADTVFLSARGLFIPGLNVTGLAAFVAIVVVLAGIVLAFWLGVTRRFADREVAWRRRLSWSAFALAFAAACAVLVAGRIPDTTFLSVPTLRGLNFKGGINVPPELAAMATAIVVYGSSYLAEIFRAGFLAVRKGQIEAAQSLGLSPWQVLTKVRLPLAIRAILPTLTNQYVWLLKATTLGIAVGFADFFMVVAVSITQSGQTIELIGILMGGFLLINYTLGSVLNRINRAIALKGTNIQ
ncbi:ABC transporter permease subunit [Acuticoccus mangrovi]|uniref:ABC transporter permease subunit n=1 Tax=Acuticoccus mangrovi TaxID=2796142 RepID=A0A934IPD1_9HYPH|nr:ABC transporter permease subunit [Acuticoccus mangrovi]MBJ3775605.1 ABC transporter permease subunit [Acuticoccus mangrovi]